MPATSTTPTPLEKVDVYVVGIVKSTASLQWCLIGQIKLTRIHVAFLFLPGVRVKRNKKPSLYNVERSGFFVTEVANNPNFVSLFHTECTSRSRQSPRSTKKKMVEPDGIEPTTSCLQSRRSPS
tara:strand:+ start:28 stop:399 length:372 start_codon:yes stop_codon:yes gene_type:complete